MFHKVIETSPGRFAYELTDGSGVGSGYRSQEAADAKDATEERKSEFAQSIQDHIEMMLSDQEKEAA